jgi:WD40 repeat protein
MAVAFSADGRTMWAVDSGGTLRACDTASGRQGPPRKLLDKPGLAACSAAAFSADGRFVAVDSMLDGAVTIHAVRDARPPRSLPGKPGGPYVLAFSPDARVLAAGERSHGPTTLQLWDVATGRPLHTLRGLKDGIQSMAFSPDSATLATGSEDKAVKLWDVASGKERLTIPDLGQPVSALAFTPDGGRLAVACGDTITLRDPASGTVVQTIHAYLHQVVAMVFTPDAKRLLTAGGAGDTARGSGVKVWDLSTGQELITLGGSDLFGCLALSADGHRLAAGSENVLGGAGMLVQAEGTVRLWDGRRLREPPPRSARAGPGPGK